MTDVWAERLSDWMKTSGNEVREYSYMIEIDDYDVIEKNNTKSLSATCVYSLQMASSSAVAMAAFSSFIAISDASFFVYSSVARRCSFSVILHVASESLLSKIFWIYNKLSETIREKLELLTN